jgi:hypothetical protein
MATVEQQIEATIEAEVNTVWGEIQQFASTVVPNLTKSLTTVATAINQIPL